MGTNTHTDTHTPSHDRYIFPLIQSVVCSMNVYSMFPFLGMFHSAAAVMFKKKKKKEFPLVFLSLCMCVCVWVQTCVRVWACVSREARNWLFLALTSHIRTQVSQALQTASSFLSCILYLLYPCLSPCISLYLPPFLVRFLDSFLLWLRHVKR